MLCFLCLPILHLLNSIYNISMIVLLRLLIQNILPATNEIYLALDLMKIMNMTVIDIHIVHIIIVGRGLDMGMYAAMW